MTLKVDQQVEVWCKEFDKWTGGWTIQTIRADGSMDVDRREEYKNGQHYPDSMGEILGGVSVHVPAEWVREVQL